MRSREKRCYTHTWEIAFRKFKNMTREKLGIFNWEIPENVFVNGAVKCTREFGGCGRWHSFDIDERGEIEFDLTWENSKGEFECEKFSDWLEEEAREE